MNLEIITVSTFYLISEYGWFGVLVDPVILQVPDNVVSATGTYDIGGGPNSLSIWMTDSFQVTPDITVQAETDRKFLILELPPAVTDQLPGGDPSNGMDIEYSLSFSRFQPLSDPVEPMRVKVMLTGKIVINQHKYYVPTLPCVTDFSMIPELEIPISNTPVDLQPTVGALLQGASAACDYQGYFFNNVPPPPQNIFLPMIAN